MLPAYDRPPAPRPATAAAAQVPPAHGMDDAVSVEPSAHAPADRPFDRGGRGQHGAVRARHGEHRDAERLAIVRVAVEQVGTPRDLAPDLRGEVEAIAREAIANALRHAGAGRIDIRLDWTAPGLVLSVVDDGTGMAPRLLARGRPGRWGLRGMRERAARIDASLALRNRPGGGFEVRVDLGRGRPARSWRGRMWRLG